MGYKSGTAAQGLVPGKVPMLQATDTPQLLNCRTDWTKRR